MQTSSFHRPIPSVAKYPSEWLRGIKAEGPFCELLFIMVLKEHQYIGIPCAQTISMKAETYSYHCWYWSTQRIKLSNLLRVQRVVIDATTGSPMLSEGAGFFKRAPHQSYNFFALVPATRCCFRNTFSSLWALSLSWGWSLVPMDWIPPCKALVIKPYSINA